MEKREWIEVEVAYASLQKQYILPMQVEAKSTIKQAILQSGLCSLCEELDINDLTVGVFSQPRLLSSGLQPGDRIEIYRPLLIDPKEARMAKARLNTKRRDTKER